MNFRPIFIAGCDRSGTTMLADMLGVSKWAVSTPESQFFHDLILQMQLNNFSQEEDAADWLLEQFRYVTWALPLDSTELADCIDFDSPRITMENLLRCYTCHYSVEKREADVWIDHTPDNFKYHSALKAIFPDARFIHIVRDGRAIAASIKPLNWGPNNAYAASRYWGDRLTQAIIVEAAEADNCLRIRYEDLVSSPVRTLHEVCNFINIPYTHSMLNGGGMQLPGFTKSQHSLVGTRPDPKRINSWRADLSAREIRAFESYPFSHIALKRLGYETAFPVPPTLGKLEILSNYCHEFAHYLINRHGHRRMEQASVAKSQVVPQENFASTDLNKKSRIPGNYRLAQDN